ncbi:MAG: hypothetical protein HUU16_16350, partial [Candidatus Omnitrophica bacterium]|nr:hypothetical protein [Candidatus Omnitrophota bacterium]
MLGRESQTLGRESLLGPWDPGDSHPQASRREKGFTRRRDARGDGREPRALQTGRRYEYDGLNLLRVDQRVDTDGDGVIEAGETAWRHVE